jgi:predicted amidohydrolase
MTDPVPFKAACIQLRSSGDVAENIRVTSALVREAAAGGARFIATPENTNIMAQDARAKILATFVEAEDPALPAFAELAKALRRPMSPAWQALVRGVGTGAPEPALSPAQAPDRN